MLIMCHFFIYMNPKLVAFSLEMKVAEQDSYLLGMLHLSLLIVSLIWWVPVWSLFLGLVQARQPILIAAYRERRLSLSSSSYGSGEIRIFQIDIIHIFSPTGSQFSLQHTTYDVVNGRDFTFLSMLSTEASKEQNPFGAEIFPWSKEKERRKEYLPYKHHFFLLLHLLLQCHCSLPHHNPHSTKRKF